MRSLFLLALAVTLSCNSQPSAVVGRQTGQTLVEQWFGVAAKPISERTPSDIELMRYAAGYLAGVADASQGKAWCYSRLVKAHEIDSELMLAMREMPPDQLRTRAAADHVVYLLTKRFPCPRKEPQ